MKQTKETTNYVVDKYESNGHVQKIDSDFRLVIIAALRAKQLQKGAHPRIEADLRRRRNTNIAVEEAKKGLIHFTLINEEK